MSVTNELEAEIAKLLKGEGENLFLVCHVISGGIGDAVIFGKLGEALVAMPIISGYKVFRMVTCYKDYETLVREELKKYKLGGETHLIVCDNKDTLVKNVQDYIAGSSASQRQLKEALKKPQAFINISTRQMESLILPALGFKKTEQYSSHLSYSSQLRSGTTEVPILSIAENGGSSFSRDRKFCLDGSYALSSMAPDFTHLSAPLMRVLGVAERHHGLVISAHPKHASKVKALAAIKNMDFLTALLGVKIKEMTEASAEKFLQDKLLVPAYFQEGPIVFNAILYGLLWYCSKKGYRELVIPINAGNFDYGSLDLDCLRQYNVSEIAIVTPLKRQKAAIIKGEPPKNALKIKILTGFYLEEEDYTALVQAAAMYGCSGDNSLELAISNGVFPICQVRVYKKYFWANFIKALKELAPDLMLDYIESMKIFNAKETKLYGEEHYQGHVRQVLNDEIIAAWPKIMQKFREKFNFYRVYPAMIQQVLCLARMHQWMKSGSSLSDKGIRRLQAAISELDKKITCRDDSGLVNLLKDLESGCAGTTIRDSACLEKNFAILGLDLRYRYYKEESLIKIFEKLQKNSNIRFLRFRDNEQDAALVWDAFLNMLSVNQNIVALDLTANDLMPKMIEELVKVLSQRTAHIAELNLSGNLFGAAGMLHLKKILGKDSKIEALDFSMTALDDEAAHILAEALKINRSLKMIKLDRNPEISSAGLIELLSVRVQKPGLVEFSLDANYMDQDEKIKISRFLEALTDKYQSSVPDIFVNIAHEIGLEVYSTDMGSASALELSSIQLKMPLAAIHIQKETSAEKEKDKDKDKDKDKVKTSASKEKLNGMRKFS